MIRRYEYGDEKRLKPNEFSSLEDVDNVFYDRSYQKYTLEDDNDIKCIMCWKEISLKKYAIFFLMPDNVEMRHVKSIKRFMDDMRVILEPRMVLTYSFDCDKLEKWHRFFGFEKDEDGSVMFQGNYLNKWVLSWA